MGKVEGFYTIGEILNNLYGGRVPAESEKAEAEARIHETALRISGLLDGMRGLEKGG